MESPQYHWLYHIRNLPIKGQNRAIPFSTRLASFVILSRKLDLAFVDFHPILSVPTSITAMRLALDAGHSRGGGSGSDRPCGQSIATSMFGPCRGQP